jgi:hypothetical protein
LSDGALLTEGTDALTEGNDPNTCIAGLFDPRTWSLTATASMLRCDDGSSFTLLLDGTVLRTGGRE